MKYNKYRIELSKVKKYAVLNKESDLECIKYIITKYF